MEQEIVRHTMIFCIEISGYTKYRVGVQVPFMVSSPVGGGGGEHFSSILGLGMCRGRDVPPF